MPLPWSQFRGLHIRVIGRPQPDSGVGAAVPPVRRHSLGRFGGRMQIAAAEMFLASVGTAGPALHGGRDAVESSHILRGIDDLPDKGGSAIEVCCDTRRFTRALRRLRLSPWLHGTRD